MKKRIISVMMALVMVFTLIPFTAFAADSNGTFTLKVYYHRDDNNYTDWNIWTWPWPAEEAERQGGKHDDFVNINSEKCATIQVPADRDWLGFIVRNGYAVDTVWDAKDISFDQFFYIGFMEPNGTIEVDVRSGVPGYTIRSVTNPSTSGSSNGADLIYIRYEDKNTITAVFSKKPNNTPTFTDKNGNSLGATVTPVSDYVYTIKIPNGLPAKTPCKLTCDGKEYDLSTPDENFYVDPNRLKVISAEFADKNTVTAQFSGNVDDPKNQIHVFTPDGSSIGITDTKNLGGNKYELKLSGNADPANDYFVDCNNSIAPITGKDKLGGSDRDVKPGSATHNGNKDITVTTSGKLNDPKGAIKVSNSDGAVEVASVTPVSDTEYKVTLKDSIDPNKDYTVTINDASTPVKAGGSASSAKARTAQYNLYDTVYAGLSEKVANPDDLKNTIKISGPNGNVGITKVEAVPGRDKLYKITVASTLDRTKSYTLSNGGSTVSIRMGLVGDANEDGLVNAKDATAVLKHTVSLITLTNNNGEVNGDGVISQKDATQILKFVVNLPSTLDKYY